MKIAVCVKQTFDTEAQIKLDGQGQISEDSVNLIINPYDEFAIEEAIRIKEKLGGEVTVISLGGARAEEALRQALAMGADKAVLLNDDLFAGGDESTTALALSKAMEGGEYDLIIGGYKAIDDGSAQVTSRLAELLNLPQVNVVTKLEVSEEKALAHREVDGGVEVVEVTMPAVVTAQKGLNEPRYPSMKGIMQAKKKELKKLTGADLGLDGSRLGATGAKVKTLSLTLPAVRTGGTVLEGTAQETARQLAGFLRKVI